MAKNQIQEILARLESLEKENSSLKESLSKKSQGGNRGKKESPQRGIAREIHRAAIAIKGRGEEFSCKNFLAEMKDSFPGAARLRGHFKEWGENRGNGLYLPLPKC